MELTALSPSPVLPHKAFFQLSTFSMALGLPKFPWGTEKDLGPEWDDIAHCTHYLAMQNTQKFQDCPFMLHDNHEGWAYQHDHVQATRLFSIYMLDCIILIHLWAILKLQMWWLNLTHDVCNNNKTKERLIFNHCWLHFKTTYSIDTSKIYVD